MLDTHVVVWLHVNALSELSARGVREIEINDLVVSPMVELELGYLHEIGRTAGPAADVLGSLASRLGLTVAQIGFGPVCAAALEVTWTRDPFDRLLIAQAVAEPLRLITADAQLTAYTDLVTVIA